MRFYLGTHMPSWLEKTDIPLFVSRRRLTGRKRLPVALGPWALDSGGFTELSMHGEWRTTLSTYIAEVRRYRDEIGNLDWAAPMDWMCEPWILAKTGETLATHQHRTIHNYLWLRDLAPDCPFVPVLQGWELGDYLRHADAYAAAGVDLRAQSTVGIGSVCRRQHTGGIARILEALDEQGLALHGFGLKTEGLRIAAHHLRSADSMSWSARGRRVRPPECGSTSHGSEANCLTFALRWRRRVLAAADAPKQLALAFGTPA